MIIQTNNLSDDGEAVVPMEDILQLVSDMVRQQRIAELEAADPKQILGLV